MTIIMGYSTLLSSHKRAYGDSIKVYIYGSGQVCIFKCTQVQSRIFSSHGTLTALPLVHLRSLRISLRVHITLPKLIGLNSTTIIAPQKSHAADPPQHQSQTVVALTIRRPCRFKLSPSLTEHITIV